MRKSLVMWAVMAGGCVVGGGDQHYAYEDLEGVIVELGNGDVRVFGEEGRASTTDVHLDLGGVGRDTARGSLDVRSDGWLVIDARGTGLGGGDIDVVVPAGLPVDVHVDRGDAEIVQEAPADIFVCVGAGSAYVQVPAGAYNLQLDGAVGSVETYDVWPDPNAEHRIAACAAVGDVEVVGR